MAATAHYEFPPYRLLPDERQLLREGVPIKLGGRAFDVLLALIERRNSTVSKNELMDLAWPRVVVEENNLEVQIVTLRKLLGYAAIATVPGRGYRFTLPVVPALRNSSAAKAQGRTFADTVGQPRLQSGLPCLYGRDEELSRVTALLAAHRLVTITGSGGVGKTRLAQSVAEAHARSSGQRMCWVDLAPLSDAALIPNAMATALGLKLDGLGDALDAIAAAVREERSALLVVDNAEHLLGGVASLIARIRDSSAGVQFLVTSQEPLHIDDELVFRLEPLALPTGDDPERIGDCGAVALFVARATAADRRFALREDNRTAVAEICRRLDGIPLAIELAAARVPLLGTTGVRDKLDQRFHVLTAGRRELPKRHQTLRAALDWSHQLLSASEQAVFRRLSAFVGGFTLEAAQEIAADEGEVDQWDALEHLGALVDKSLVVAEGDSLPRYRMLETTRLFALERLVESGEAETVRRRHRDHYLHLAEECERSILSDHARTVMERLDRERDNLITAMKWSVNDEDARLGRRLASAMGLYWLNRGMASTGADLTALTLSRSDGADAIRCRALITAGWLSMWAGKVDEAVKKMEAALTIARTLDDGKVLCHVLARFAHVRHNQEEVQASLYLAEEAIQVGKETGESEELGDALVIRALVARKAGDLQLARQLLTQALELRQRAKNAVGSASAMGNLARVEIEVGEIEAARFHLEQAATTATLVDSYSLTLLIIGLVAQLAAKTQEADAALLFEASCIRQLRRAGMKDWLSPEEARWLESAAAKLTESRRKALLDEAETMMPDQALLRAKRFLAGDGGWCSTVAGSGAQK